MRKKMVKLGALLMAAMMIAPPASYVRAAEGMEGTETGWEDVQEDETEAGDGMEMADDGGITTYGLSSGIYIVTAHTAKVRSGPGTGYSVVGTLKQNTKIRGSSFGKKWVKTKYDNQTAYVNVADLKKSGK